MTISELRIQLDLQSENRIDILKDVTREFLEGYLFVDSSNGYCCLFDEDGNEDDIKKLKTIDNELFYDSNIESIIIPDSVKSIEDSAFTYCRSLESIVIPDSVKRIGDCAFAWCGNLTSIVIPDSIKRIGDSAFYGCESLKSITIPDSIKKIGDSAFYGCESLKSLAFKGKTIDQIKAMRNYPFGITDKSIIRCI